MYITTATTQSKKNRPTQVLFFFPEKLGPCHRKQGRGPHRNTASKKHFPSKFDGAENGKGQTNQQPPRPTQSLLCHAQGGKNKTLVLPP
jgi:hypothetical protein